MTLGRLGLVVVLMLGVVVVVLGGFWADYIFRKDTPYDEVGIGLNSSLPRPVREYGCRTLKERHGNVVPPYGCADFPFWSTRR